MQLLDGKALSEKILEEIKQKVASFKSRPPHIVVVIVGQNPASHLYVSKKTKMCQQVGIKSTLLHFDSSISQQNLIDTLEKLNQDRLDFSSDATASSHQRNKGHANY